MRDKGVSRSCNSICHNSYSTLAPYFELVQTAFGNNSILVYLNEERKEYYKFQRKTLRQNIYRCLKCENKKKSVTAIFVEDENGVKSVILRDTKHYCIPCKTDESDTTDTT